jgi:pimeloyl-ACP methyl ester carboxylesterase
MAVGAVPTRVYDAGDGEPLLLIHGGQFGSLYSLDCWSLNLDDLSERFRVIAPDKFGQGHTGIPRRAEEYVLDSVYGHIVGLIDTLKLESLHVVGHSRGGAPALRLALDRPGSVKSLVLLSTGSVAPSDPASPVGSFYRPFEIDPGIDVVGRDAVIAEPQAQAIDPSWITDDFVTRMSVIANLPAQRLVRAAFSSAEHEHWRPSLEFWRAANLAAIDARRLNVPTLILWGHEDRSASRHQGIRLFERIAATNRRVQLLIVAGAGHYVFRDRPDTFAHQLTAFAVDVG